LLGAPFSAPALAAGVLLGLIAGDVLRESDFRPPRRTLPCGTISPAAVAAVGTGERRLLPLGALAAGCVASGAIIIEPEPTVGVLGAGLTVLELMSASSLIRRPSKLDIRFSAGCKLLSLLNGCKLFPSTDGSDGSVTGTAVLARPFKTFPGGGASIEAVVMTGLDAERDEAVLEGVLGVRDAEVERLVADGVTFEADGVDDVRLETDVRLPTEPDGEGERIGVLLAGVVVTDDDEILLGVAAVTPVVARIDGVVRLAGEGLAEAREAVGTGDALARR
jgi:hypothetical protein